MEELERDVALALNLLGLAGREVVKARYEGNELVLLIDCGILGIQKHYVAVDTVRALIPAEVVVEEPVEEPVEEKAPVIAAPKPRRKRG